MNIDTVTAIPDASSIGIATAASSMHRTVMFVAMSGLRPDSTAADIADAMSSSSAIAARERYAIVVYGSIHSDAFACCDATNATIEAKNISIAELTPKPTADDPAAPIARTRLPSDASADIAAETEDDTDMARDTSITIGAMIMNMCDHSLVLIGDGRSYRNTFHSIATSGGTTTESSGGAEGSADMSPSAAFPNRSLKVTISPSDVILRIVSSFLRFPTQSYNAIWSLLREGGVSIGAEYKENFWGWW